LLKSFDGGRMKICFCVTFLGNHLPDNYGLVSVLVDFDGGRNTFVVRQELIYKLMLFRYEVVEDLVQLASSLMLLSHRTQDGNEVVLLQHLLVSVQLLVEVTFDDNVFVYILAEDLLAYDKFSPL
jgi:hypothetical protein